MNIFWLHRWRLLGSLLIVGIIQRLAPWARAEDPAWFKLNGMPQPSVGLEVDSSRESTRIGGVTSTYDTLWITPTIGLRASGSIYHPNLLTFDFDGELGWGWDRMTTTSPGYNQTRNESDDLFRYRAQLYLFKEKPYNATVFASQDRTYRDYGSFDTYTVDSTRYGGAANWNKVNLSLTTDFGYRHETDTGLVNSSEVTETYFNFLGVHRRHFGQTSLNCRFDMFDNILNLGNTVTSINESVGISDSEIFGQRKQITESTGATYSHSEYSGQLMDTVNANENVTVHHRPSLDSYLVFDFEHSDLHPATDQRWQGISGVRHQLYESLTSTLDAHGSYQNNSDSANFNTLDRYGLGLAETYTKRLRSWGRLSIGAGIILDHEDDSSTGGTFTTVDEAQQLYLPTNPQYRPVYLNRPRVIASSIRVTSGGQLLVAGSDYEVVKSGQLTEVRLLNPPSSQVLILTGGAGNLTALVTYQSESSNNASYETISGNFQVRLDLPFGFGVYGRMNWVDNNAPPSVLTQTLTDLVGGVDYHRRWFRAGAEYEDYDSNYSQYKALRFYQNFDFRLDDRSSLGLGFNETFYHYTENGDQTVYQFVTTYNIQLWSSVSWYVQGGCSLQDVPGNEQVQGSAQTGLKWTRGKLSVRTGYEYNNLSTTSGSFSEQRDKNRIFAYLKRTF